MRVRTDYIIVSLKPGLSHSARLRAGDGVRGGGCCANLPVFFSQNSGLVAVVAHESASILPETMEDSLCSSLAAAPEVNPAVRLQRAAAEARGCFSDLDAVLKVSATETPTRAEPLAQEDKTKLLKAAFLQFCRYVRDPIESLRGALIHAALPGLVT